jgi:excisionase family DNA binding protein
VTFGLKGRSSTRTRGDLSARRTDLSGLRGSGTIAVRRATSGGNSPRQHCENWIMKRHLPQQPRDSGRPSVASADFSELPSVLTSREAANVLRVGVREVRALVDSGQLPGTRVGPRKVVRISRAAVLAMLGVQSAG